MATSNTNSGAASNTGGLTTQQPGLLSNLWRSIRAPEQYVLGTANKNPSATPQTPSSQDGSVRFDPVDPVTADKLQKAGFIGDKAFSQVVSRDGFTLKEAIDLANAGEILEIAWFAVVGNGYPYPVSSSGLSLVHRKQYSNPLTTAITAASTAATTTVPAMDLITTFTVKLPKNRRLVCATDADMYAKPGTSWTSNLTRMRLFARITSQSDADVSSSDQRTFTVAVYSITEGNGSAVAAISAGSYEGLLELYSFPDGKIDVSP